MNTQSITPAIQKEIYKVPFKVHGKLSLILHLKSLGVIVNIDPSYKYACAHFDNLIDCNKFKQTLELLPAV